MAAANISSEKVDLLIYGPVRPILENGFSDQYVLHMAESRADLERLTPETIAKIRGEGAVSISKARNGRELRRRLRSRRFRLCA